jgi:hypothetical protein
VKLVTKSLDVWQQRPFRFAQRAVCLLSITCKASEFTMNDLMLCQCSSNLFGSRRVVAQVSNSLFALETKAKFEAALTASTPLLVNKPLRL